MSCNAVCLTLLANLVRIPKGKPPRKHDPDVHSSRAVQLSAEKRLMSVHSGISLFVKLLLYGSPFGSPMLRELHCLHDLSFIAPCLLRLSTIMSQKVVGEPKEIPLSSS